MTASTLFFLACATPILWMSWRLLAGPRNKGETLRDYINKDK